MIWLRIKNGSSGYGADEDVESTLSQRLSMNISVRTSPRRT